MGSSSAGISVERLRGSAAGACARRAFGTSATAILPWCRSSGDARRLETQFNLDRIRLRPLFFKAPASIAEPLFDLSPRISGYR